MLLNSKRMIFRLGWLLSDLVVALIQQYRVPFHHYCQALTGSITQYLHRSISLLFGAAPWGTLDLCSINRLTNILGLPHASVRPREMHKQINTPLLLHHHLPGQETEGWQCRPIISRNRRPRPMMLFDGIGDELESS
ncbi:hypothetical protein F5Y17DRAFT_451208 [Xylariaceae sp. FL0594]|nr:hypothetical protein F5Y17DRAFT_451208 [Xylariaceae sp. FL0594]